MYLCTRNYDLKRGGTFETAKAGTFHSVTAGTLIPLSPTNCCYCNTKLKQEKIQFMTMYPNIQTKNANKVLILSWR